MTDPRPRAVRAPLPSRRPLAVLAALALLPAAARATLGEQAASVGADRRALAAVSRGAVDHGRYAVHELATGGSTVREYLTPSGQVFAIAWSGYSHPDLAPLLGGYAAEYQEARRQTARVPGLRRSRVASGRAVVETWGHMRDLHGRAYAPALVPAGVGLDEIR